MAQKFKGRIYAPHLEGGSEVRQTEPGTGVSVSDTLATVRRARYTLTGLVINVDADDDYGSAKLCDLPDRNLLLLAVEADLVLTKGGTATGIVAATDLDVGMGTAPASATTLATTMIDIFEKQDLDTDALAVDFHAHTNDQSTAVFPKKIVDAATTALYLNAVAVGGITVDDTITATGIVDIYYVELGNLSS